MSKPTRGRGIRELRPNMALKLAIVATQRPQYAIAFAVGLSPGGLSAIVRGINTPTLEQARQIAEAIGQPARKLFPRTTRNPRGAR